MKAALREILETLLLTLLIFVIVRVVVQNFKVEGQSMEPTLSSGQYLLINKAIYWRVEPDESITLGPFNMRLTDQDKTWYLFGSPQRGDVIVFRFPRDTTRDFIKRVIGIPGDSVEIRDNRVYVNGQPLQEPYTKEAIAYSPQPVVTVPSGHFYVLGDNRNNSSDSHSWGVVPEENIIGKAWIRYWPLNDWGLVPNTAIAFGNASP
ncbi:MAG: signal peptidase I [Chloroflexi bacterium]|nr:signal peptidase I [Chloroflexota bacterium]